MRLDGGGVGVHEHRKHVFVVQLFHAREVVVVALVERFADRLVVLAGQLQAQPVVLDAAAPQVARFVFRLRPAGFFAVDLEGFIGGEFEFPLDQLAGVGHALGKTLLIGIVDGERQAQILVLDRIVELGAAGIELVDIGLHEIQFFGIEVLEITVEDLLGHGVVERHGLVVIAREKFRRPQGRLGLGRFGLELNNGALVDGLWLRHGELG